MYIGGIPGKNSLLFICQFYYLLPTMAKGRTRRKCLVDPLLNNCPQLASYMILISVTQTAFRGFEEGVLECLGLQTIVMYGTTQLARLPCSGVKSGLGVFEGSWALPLAGAIPYVTVS